MPKGSFAVLLPKESDYKILGYYFKKSIDFTITGDLFLRLNLDHERNEINLLRLKDLIIFSYLYQLKGKLALKASSLIIGLILEEDDDPETFRTPLKEYGENLGEYDLMSLTQEKFEIDLKKLYQEHIERLTDILDPDVIKRSIINKTKEMLSGGKKERKTAQELLEKIEDNVHTKISELYVEAENALKSFEYDKAEKFFNKASEIAEELFQEELAKSLKERANVSIKIPDLTKKLDDIVQKARSFLRKEDFHGAYIFYRKASEISKELMLPEKEEEFTLKSKALQDFYQVDQKFRKKK